MFWETKTGKSHIIRNISSARVCSTTLSYNNRTLALGYNKGNIQLWDTQRIYHPRQQCYSLNRLDRIFNHEVTFAPNNKMLACGTGSGIKLWDSRAGILMCTFLDTSWSSLMAVSPDSRIPATADDKIRLWNLTTGYELSTSFACKKDIRVNLMSFSQNGNVLATRCVDNNNLYPKTIKLWDVEACKLLQTFHSKP